jgi:hypothetical protein
MGRAHPDRTRRRSARNRARTRRAICAASAGARSPRATAVRTADSACRKSLAVRNDATSIPRRVAGSMAASATGAACGRADPTAPARSAAGATRSGTRRLGLGMPRGRPRGLPELPVAKRPRASRAREKGIRTKLLIFLDSISRKQQITVQRRWIGNDLRHPQGPGDGARERARDRACMFMIRSDQGRRRRTAVNSSGGHRFGVAPLRQLVQLSAARPGFSVAVSKWRAQWKAEHQALSTSTRKSRS